MFNNELIIFKYPFVKAIYAVLASCFCSDKVETVGSSPSTISFVQSLAVLTGTTQGRSREFHLGGINFN